MFRRRTLLVLAIAGIAPAIVLITTLTGSARERRQRLAEQWAARGAHDLAAGQSAVAAEDYRAAQEYAHDHHEYRLQLAQALVAAGRTLEARSELETLWSEAPGSGLINEQLARLAAADGADADAMRFYHAAIDGAWPAGAAAARRQARLELAELLFDRGHRPQAEAELAALLGDSPIDPRAWRLAGRVAFARGDYEAAAARLGAAARAMTLDPPDAEQLAVSRRVLALDPYARAIGARERLRRVLRAAALLSAALGRCQADTLDEQRRQMEDLRRGMTERSLARDPDAVDEALAVLASVEHAVAAACGVADQDQRALALVFKAGRS
jgi:tetratricopeptide (TPR) repeat protein